MDNITPPLFTFIPPEGRGVIQEGVEGGPPIVGGIYKILYSTPPIVIICYLIKFSYYKYTDYILEYQIMGYKKKG